MKNILSLLSILLISAIVLLGKIYYNTSTHDIAFNQIHPFRNTISKELINNFFSNDEELEKSSASIIKEISLRDLDYDNWMDYSEYIEVLLFPLDAIDDHHEDLIIALNLSKDTAVVGIYKLIEDNYVFTNKIEDLTPINKVYSIKDESNDRTFLLIEQMIDEMLGAYYVDNYIQIFTQVNDDFKEVHSQSLDYTSFYYEKWNNPSLENPKWYKLTEKSTFGNISDTNIGLSFNVSRKISRYIGNETADDLVPDDFTLDNEQYVNITFVWSKKYNYFIQGEGKLKSDGTIVGILDKSDEKAMYPLEEVDKYFKVIDENGKILYIKDIDLEILSSYSS